MNEYLKRAWAQIDLDAIDENFKEIRRSLDSKVRIMCVVKADAYGHGAEYIARELESLGADWFAVSNIEEALQLRRYGVNRPILVLGYTPVDMAETLYNFNISQTVFSYDYAVKLITVCRDKGVKIKAHIKLDTGMNRIGFMSQGDKDSADTAELIRKLAESKCLEFEGIFTHFAVADDPINGREFTELQFKDFIKTVNMIQSKGIKIPFKHCCNSGGIIDHKEMHLDMVRAGVILYGLLPSKELSGRINLRPAMSLKTVISQIKKIPKGSSVSYGRTFVTNKQTIVATVPIGYADGYLRKFSDRASMLVCGKRVPVTGRVCMDQLMLDVTEIEGICEGEEVIVFGSDKSQEISLDELSLLADTINYEIVCLIGKRVPRVYCKGGNNIGKLSYM